MEKIAPPASISAVWTSSRRWDAAEEYRSRGVDGREEVVAVSPSEADRGPLDQIGYEEFGEHARGLVWAKVVGEQSPLQVF